MHGMMEVANFGCRIVASSILNIGNDRKTCRIKCYCDQKTPDYMNIVVKIT